MGWLTNNIVDARALHTVNFRPFPGIMRQS